jgi:phospholipid-translocating ATPase
MSTSTGDGEHIVVPEKRHDEPRQDAQRWGFLPMRPATQREDQHSSIIAKLRQIWQWVYSYLILELLLRRRSHRASKHGRVIPLDLAEALKHGDKLLIDERRDGPFISNAIRTSRYTLWDFFPKQLLFQCSRLNNFYFICIGIPQTIPGLSTTGNFTTILPLLFFILLTIVKEGYDDYKRHRLDNVENARLAKVLRPVSEASEQPSGYSFRLFSPWRRKGHTPVVAEAPECGYGWHMVGWKDIRVGDVLKISRDDDIPADIVLLHADGETSQAYVETMALDGETNLKSKQPSVAFEGCDGITALSNRPATFVVEDPNPDLYRFEGRVTVAANGLTSPLTLNEVVYRGSTLRNTPNVIGLVVNTGEETKMRRNANRHPTAKRPALELITNRVVLTLVFYVLILSIGCSVGYVMWQGSYESRAFYLQNASVPFYQIIIAFLIQFNNVIPLALYISLEIVKIGQMIMLNSDVAMYDGANDTPARCNTNTILENLGQIGYIFSDKTGTLTENVMKFRKMSIAGTVWLHERDLQESLEMSAAGLQLMPEQEKQRDSEQDLGLVKVVSVVPEEPSVANDDTAPVRSHRPSMARRSSSHWRSTGRPDHTQPDVTTEDLLQVIKRDSEARFAQRAKEYLLGMALCHTCLPELRDGKVAFEAASPDELALVEAAQELGYALIQRSPRIITLAVPGGLQQTYEILDVIEFSSRRKRMSIVLRCPDGRIWLLCKGADSTIIPRLRTADLAMQKVQDVRKSAEVEHEALRQSEQGAARSSFGGRTSLSMRRSIVLNRAHGSSSVRPVMPRSQSTDSSGFNSAVLQRFGPSLTIPSRAVSLEVPKAVHSPRLPLRSSQLTTDSKFAFLEDSAVTDDAEIYSRCFKHLDDFASEGLRTLLFAHKFVLESEYRSWKKLYNDATTSLTDRDERVEAAGALIEQNLELLGASAIEDKLQHGVPETIDRLRRANIKIWMLTGDKRETAINIAHSARICRPSSDVYILDAAKGDLDGQLQHLVEDLHSANHLLAASTSSHTVVVVDGHTLAAIEDPGSAAAALRARFNAAIPLVDSVICCRASPAQKALLVRTMRKSTSLPTNKSWLGGFCRTIAGRTPPLTLAIGDGANDLAMLAAAHVGVGISGREGLQAARVADYSIAQFRFLSRLLLVHGRYDYVRTAAFILWTFWKEMFFYMPTTMYQRFNGYTGTSLYENWSLTVLNTLFTSLCVVIPGIFEKDLSRETLLAVPELYVFGQRDGGLNAAKYFWWMLGAVTEGMVVWWGCWAGYGAFTEATADAGLFAIGDLAFTTCILWTNWKLL